MNKLNFSSKTYIGNLNLKIAKNAASFLSKKVLVLFAIYLFNNYIFSFSKYSFDYFKSKKTQLDIVNLMTILFLSIILDVLNLIYFISINFILNLN